jgi:hypothetical protein
MRLAIAPTLSRVLWAAAAALFGLLLSSLCRVDNVPPAIIVGLFGLAAVTTRRPGGGAIVVALLVPSAMWIGRKWNWTIAWPETIAVAFLFGYAVRRAFESRGREHYPLDVALHSLIAVVAASLLVQFLVLRQTIGGEALRSQLWQLLSVNYFIGTGGFESVDAAMRLVEGLLLLHAGAGLARTSPAFAPLLVRAFVVGAVASSALNLWRVWLGALRLDDPAVAFLRYLATLRFHTHYPDVNAAGSYYVMALLPALGLARERALWIPAAVLIGLSLIMSGSRAAIMSGAMAAVVAWWVWRSRTPRESALRVRSGRGLVIAILLAVICAGAVYLLFARNLTPTATALGLRAEFAATGVRMGAARPAFGVGIGRYYTLSSEFSSPRLRATYPHENAHNNFLQVLAELGVVGLAAFVSVLGLAAVSISRLLSPASETFLPRGVAAGLLAFMLTWLLGHPLLIDPPALLFWLLLGTAAGWGALPLTQAPSAERGGTLASVTAWWSRHLRWLPAALLFALAASIPSRVSQDLAAANLEHLGIGLSGWDTGQDGVQYRLAGVTSTVFVPSEAAVITLPLKSVAEGSELEVELHLDGRYADMVRVRGDGWRVLTIQMPRREDGRRFRALELRVREGYRREPPLLMVGKVQPR